MVKIMINVALQRDINELPRRRDPLRIAREGHAPHRVGQGLVRENLIDAFLIHNFFSTFDPAKVPQNRPTITFAYFMRPNAGNGRLFAGLQANRPRFLPLLAGPSFLGFGIGPGSFAAKRGGRDASGTSRKHRSLRSPLEAVLNRRIIACSGIRTTAVFARGVLCTFWCQK